MYQNYNFRRHREVAVFVNNNQEGALPLEVDEGGTHKFMEGPHAGAK